MNVNKNINPIGVMNILGLKQIEKIYQQTRPRWVSSKELHHMGSQLRIAYVTGYDHLKYDTPEQVPVQELRYYLEIKDRRIYENGLEEYLIEFVDW